MHTLHTKSCIYYISRILCYTRYIFKHFHKLHTPHTSHALHTLHTLLHIFHRGDEEEEEYDFEYSDEEEEETDVDLENSYYAAKALKLEDPRAAVEAFREVSNFSMVCFVGCNKS